MARLGERAAGPLGRADLIADVGQVFAGARVSRANDEYCRWGDRTDRTGAASLPLLAPPSCRRLPTCRPTTANGISDRLFVSRHTVKAEVKIDLPGKLGVSSRHEAVQKATAIGLLGA